MWGGLYFYDEFISMLAAQRVAESGLSLMPSGLFYGQGLLLSYLTGPLIALVGFKEEVARWPVLLLSVLTIAAYYAAARRLFNSPLAGLLAASLVTLDELSILWGTRARMYSQTHLFVLLTLTWLLWGTLQNPRPRFRYLTLTFLAAILFSHAVSFLILPPLLLLILIFSLLYRRDWLDQPRLWLEALVAMAVGGAALVVMIWGTFKPESAQSGGSVLGDFLELGLAWGRFDNLVGFFDESAYAWLLPFIGLALILTAYHLLRRQVEFAQVVLLFLALFIALLLFEMGGLVSDTWSKSRYVFIVALPAFLLLGAGSLALLLTTLLQLVARLSRNRLLLRGVGLAGGVVALALIAFQWGPAAWNMAGAKATGDYHTAFAYVRQHWQPGDRVMTTHPAAAYLYLRRNDYYANQVTAIVFESESEENALLDRYTGSPLVASVEALNAILNSGQRLWFVVDAQRLYERFEPFFTQQILAQMDLVEQTGPTYIFRSRSYPTPLPEQPSARLDVNFSNMIRLEGYHLDPADLTPDGTLLLGLYWRPIAAPPHQLKVFVQLRNAQNQIVAQADHFLLEGLLTFEAWNALQQKGEWLRDTADLNLPLPLLADSGPYQLYVGFYDPNTLERVPIMGDTSGENAVVINLPSVSGAAR